MSKILIFGNGYVGSNIYKNSPTSHNIKIYNKQEHSYDEPHILLDILSKEKPDYVINCCGYTGSPNVDACESDKRLCWELNVNFPVTLATICNSLQITLLHVSSGCIYTGYEYHYDEVLTPNFGLNTTTSSWYSKTKHASEIALKGLNCHIFRIRMPFSHGNHDRNFLNKVLKYDKLIDYKNSMTCIEDFVNFIFKYIEILSNEIKTPYIHRKLVPGIYNVCNPGSVSIKDIVKIFKQAGLINANWQFVNIKSLNLTANRSNCILNCKKISNLKLSLPEVRQSLKSAIDSITLDHPYLHDIKN